MGLPRLTANDIRAVMGEDPESVPTEDLAAYWQVFEKRYCAAYLPGVGQERLDHLWMIPGLSSSAAWNERISEFPGVLN